MEIDKIKEMIVAAAGANHVGEYPAGKFCPMPNKVGSIHAVSDLLTILELVEQRDKLISVITAMLDNDCPLTGNPTHDQIIEYWEYEKSKGRGEAGIYLDALTVTTAVKGGAV